MKNTFIAMLVIGMLVACEPKNISIPLETKEPSTTAPSPSAAATVEANVKPTLSNTVTAIPVFIPPPVGIVYRTNSGLWQVGNEGKPALIYQLVDDTNASLNPTGTHILYVDDAANSQNRVTQYIVDISTLSKIQVYPHDNLNICLFSWMPGHMDFLYTVLLPDGADPGYSCQRGSPVLMSLDGSDLIVLDKGASGWSSPSVSPNGEYIAFDKHGEPWLYEWGKTAHLFDTNRYGIPPSNVTEFSAPSWSPDSTKLAWIRLEKTEENEQKYIIIFDIKNQTFTSLYPCHDEGNVACGLYDFEGSPHIEWSGDGKYLSILNYGLDFYGIFSLDGRYERMLDDGFYALEWNPTYAWYGRIEGTKSCLQVFIESANGQESHQVGCGRILDWSPDGSELIFGEKEHGWWLVNIKTWSVNQIDMPNNSEIIDWIKFPNQ